MGPVFWLLPFWVTMAWRQVAYNYLKAAAALRASSREQLAVYIRLAAQSDSATAYKRVLDDAGEVRLSSVLKLSGDAMAPAFLHGDQVRCVVLLPNTACCHPDERVVVWLPRRYALVTGL